jgi:hypothetical protein
MTDQLPEGEESLEQMRERLAYEAQLSDDFRGIMSTVQGRRFVWSMLVQFGAFRELFDESHALMAYKEGRRQIGLYLIHKINVDCPDQYQVMTNENTTYTSKEN